MAKFLRTSILKKICERLFLSVSRSDFFSEKLLNLLFKSNFAESFLYTILFRPFFKDNNFLSF